MSALASEAIPTATDVGLRSRLSAAAMAASGVLIVVGHGLSIDPNLPTDDYIARMTADRTQGVAGGLMVAVGALLLPIGLVALLGLVRRRGAGLALAGAILAGCGAMALGAGDVMITLIMGGLSRDHGELAGQVMDLAAGDRAPLLSLPFLFAPLLVLGLILCGAALIRSRAVPWWEGAVLILGAALVLVSAGGGWAAAALPLTPLGVALVLLARRAVVRGR